MILECASCGASNRVPARRLEEHPRCGRCKTALSTDHPIAVRTAIG